MREIQLVFQIFSFLLPPDVRLRFSLLSLLLSFRPSTSMTRSLLRSLYSAFTVIGSATTFCSLWDALITSR